MDSENPAKPIVSAQKMTAGLHRHYARLNGQLRLIREILKALGLIPLALRHGRPLIQSLAQRKRQRSHLQLRQ